MHITKYQRICKIIPLISSIFMLHGWIQHKTEVANIVYAIGLRLNM